MFVYILYSLPVRGLCCPRAADFRERPRTYIHTIPYCTQVARQFLLSSTTNNHIQSSHEESAINSIERSKLEVYSKTYSIHFACMAVQNAFSLLRVTKQGGGPGGWYLQTWRCTLDKLVHHWSRNLRAVKSRI